jgi:polyisoprenoid-binding protein YceI
MTENSAKKPKQSRNRLIFIGGVLMIALVAAYLAFDRLFPNDYNPSVTGVPTSDGISSIDRARTSTAQARTPSGMNDNGITFASYTGDVVRDIPSQTDPLFKSCTEARVSRPEGRPDATAEPTMEATMGATMEATMEATMAAEMMPSGTPDLVRVAVVGAESEACYQIGEIFLNNNEFRVAVGVTRSIEGEIEIDRDNIANSVIGDIKINISEFRSDEGRRDTAIQRRWIETNTYPFATLSEVRIVGLPARKYVDGETLKFQVVGMLELRQTKLETTFDVEATLTGDLLVVRAVAPIKLTDFNIEPPTIGGFVSADNDMIIVLNLVARPKTS